MSYITEYVKKGKSLIDILKLMLNEEHTLEIEKAKENLTLGELEEKLDDIERNYEFNKEKFNYVDLIKSSDVAIQKKFLDTLMYIDSCEYSKYNQVATILTLATMLNKFGIKLAEDFTPKDLCFFATVMVSIPLEKYETYGYMISKNITRIMNKTNNEQDQRSICYTIFDYCDLFLDSNSKKEEMDNYLDDISELIRNYKINEKAKGRKI